MKYIVASARKDFMKKMHRRLRCRDRKVEFELRKIGESETTRPIFGNQEIRLPQP